MMSNTPSAAAALPPCPGGFGGSGPQYPPSFMNSYRPITAADRLSVLAAYVRSGSNHNQHGSRDFYDQCLSLAQDIDRALANGEILDKANDLPALMKQLCWRKNDGYSQAALMVLMIYVKNACKMGWFLANEAEEMFTIADEIGKIYCNMGNINAEPSCYHSTISTIMERFYPNLNLGQILVSVEAKPGYGAYTADFHISKSMVLQDKIWLLVAQTDNIETSACLISPQQVSFLLNGKAVDRRTNVSMDPGPQMPTNVSSMLTFGTNLLQAVGQFNGHYVILVAHMSVKPLHHPVLQDYVQAAATPVDTDSDIIEGASRISLNCPISSSRIKTPVKGHSCKHFQCFDFDNFIDMNSRRPSWRCPYCNQYVSYADIRLDRNMVEILKDIGENIVKVIVLADGSWKAAVQNDQNADKMQNMDLDCEKEPPEAQKSICSPNAVSDVLDLTVDDYHLEIMDTFEIADRKTFPVSVSTQFVSPNSASLGMNTTGVNQNVAAHMEDDFWSGLDLPFGRSDTPTVGVSEHPVLPDTVSPALNQEAEGHDNNRAVNSVMHYQVPSQSNLQLQHNYINSAVNENGRSPSLPRHDRTPLTAQGPAHSVALGPQQTLITNLNSLLPSCSTATPQASLSNTATADGSISILTDTERRHHFSQSPLNLPLVSGVNSSALQHRSALQNRVSPVPSQLPKSNRPSGSSSELRNSHLQQALNSPRTHPMMQQRSHIQQGGSNVHSAGAPSNGRQTSVKAPAQVCRNPPPGLGTPYTGVSFCGLTGNQRGNVGGTAQSVSWTDDLLNSQLEQNWRPTARMRGSLSGRPISDDIRNLICAPTQGSQPVQGSMPHGPQAQGPCPEGSIPVQGSRPVGSQPVHCSMPLGQLPVQSPRPPVPQPLQGSQPSRPTSLSSQLNVLVANNRNAYNHSSNA